ncbi:MAG TPA: DUF364 domain-containing protein [Anaerolineae bacterium]|nr:DUF364 domain-containing protein [Anaerolineae bacterium]
MKLLEKLLLDLPDGDVVDVRIGLHWTAVVTQLEGKQRCGLASTLGSPHEHSHEPQVPQAGQLKTLTGRELATLALEKDQPTLASVGVAALNALLPLPEVFSEVNAEYVLADCGADKRVAIVGHFPFIPRLRERVAELIVLERDPRKGDMPAQAASEVLPQSDVVAITGMALANHTLEGLLTLCKPEALVMVLGPSTPLSPILYDYGVDMLSGSIVAEIEPVLRAVSQGANFRQVHRAGVRLVTVKRPGFND